MTPMRPKIACVTRSASGAGPEEMAARLPYGVAEAQHTNVDVPLPCRLALVVQVTAVPPDRRCGLAESRDRLLPFVLGFWATVGGQVTWQGPAAAASPFMPPPNRDICARSGCAARIQRT
jgi:hypothetical protein